MPQTTPFISEAFAFSFGVGSEPRAIAIGSFLPLHQRTRSLSLPVLTISILFDLDDVTDDGWAVFVSVGFGDVVPEGLHIPGGCWAAFGAEAAVEANVFVLDHYAAGLEAVLNVDRLSEILGRDLCA